LQVLYIASTLHYKYFTLQVIYITNTLYCKYFTLQVLYITSTLHYKYFTLQVLYITSILHEYLCKFIKYVAKVFLEWVQPQKNRENQRHICVQKFLSRKSWRLLANVEKYGTARQATDDNTMRRMRMACWITKTTDTPLKYLIIIAVIRQTFLR
jgi:hypothetical protein